MEPALARNIAHYSHTGECDRFGDPLIEHIERVAAAVEERDRAVAFLHDVLEKSGTDVEELIAQGLTPLELAALDLLTREPGETYEMHTLRLAHAPGPAGQVARRVKLADLEDHLERAPAGSATPPYAWAKLHVLVSQERRGEIALA